MKVIEDVQANMSVEPGLEQDLVINAYLLRGMYKVAREKQINGDLNSAKRIYRFIAKQYRQAPQLKCCEIALSASALAELATVEGYQLEAEQWLIQAITVCVDYLGEKHPVSLEVFEQYAELLRNMCSDLTDAPVIIFEDENEIEDESDIDEEDDFGLHHLPLAS